MKPSVSLKAFALILAVSSFGFARSAMAGDGENRDIAVGIIGQVVTSTIEAEQQKQEAKEQEQRCARLQYKCKHGSDWSCEKYEESCGD